MASIATHMKRSISDIRLQVVTVVLVVLQLVGIIGLHSGAYGSWFEQIAWVNMLISFVLVLGMYSRWPGLQIVFAGVALVVAMAAEIIGVQRGWLFGDYHYAGIAGPWLLGVPLVIGLNWVLLSICTGTLAAALFHHTAARIIAAALLMVGIDILLERFATAHHLWVWEHGGIPPLMNYVTWAVVAMVLQSLYVALWRDHGNKAAIIYLIVLSLFLVADVCFAHRPMYMSAWNYGQPMTIFDHIAGIV